MKVCARCMSNKPESDFPKNKSRNDGLGSYCKVCMSSYLKERRRDPNSGYKEREAEYRELYREYLRDYHSAWRFENRQQFNDNCAKAQLKYRASPHGKAKTSYWNSKRRAAKLNAVPSWHTTEDATYIVELFKLCECISLAMGTQYHVDHIIPLQNELVCGLHTPDNLQILEASENCKKSNSFEVI